MIDACATQLRDTYWIDVGDPIRNDVDCESETVSVEKSDDATSGRSSRTHRAREVRSRTENMKKTSMAALRRLALLQPEEEEVHAERPKVRSECLAGGSNEERPCPFVSCEYHMYLEVKEKGNLYIRFPDIEPDQIEPTESCALDIADRGGGTFEEVGRMLNVTRERVRQLELRAVARPDMRESLRRWIGHTTNVETIVEAGDVAAAPRQPVPEAEEDEAAADERKASEKSPLGIFRPGRTEEEDVRAFWTLRDRWLVRQGVEEVAPPTENDDPVDVEEI